MKPVIRAIWLTLAALPLCAVLSVGPAAAACNESPRAGVDWSKCEKRRLILRGQDLSKGTFLRTDFSRSDLADAKLIGADLTEANFEHARLAGADLSGAVLIKSSGDRADFAKAVLRGADLTKAEMARTDFTGAHLLYIVVFKAHIYYGVYWMIVGAAHAVEYHRRYRETEWISSQLEAKLANAELDRLKAQLQPHFLFNAHHAIVALMLKRDNDAAIRMLTRLSDLLRISLARSGQQYVTLREELETLRLYLDIQHERFRDRLTINLDAPPELEAAEFPHLLLQPLVENALHHGLEDVTENARLEVAVSRDADVLICTVRDNGVGFGADGEASGSAGNGNGKGIGLVNPRDRLQQLYGAEQSLMIASTPGGGCAVTVRIPYRAPATPPRLATAGAAP
jgi:uncharacterized protein YjbI with pentapeptide repeats/two-component sensor histidine kinase